METSDLLKKVRKIEIKSKGLTNQIFAGQYHSAFKGKGMAFSEVREYQYGDDIRSIDWNVTARFNHPYVKVYDEERELTVMLLIDVSASQNFGSIEQFKQDKAIEIAAVLAFSAIKNNDKVGVIFFSDKIEKFIPPKKGTTHILRIIRELIDFKRQSIATNITEPLRFLTNAIKKRCTAFIISDFYDNNFEDALKIAGRKHDLIAIRLYDALEKELPNLGLVKFMDAETGETKWIDTNDALTRKNYYNSFKQKEIDLQRSFMLSGVEVASIGMGEDFVKPLIKLFKRRGRGTR